MRGVHAARSRRRARRRRVEPRGAVTPPATCAPRDRRVDRRVSGVEERVDVDRRAKSGGATGAGSARSRSASLAPRGSRALPRSRRHRTRGACCRRVVRRAAAVRPRGRADELQDDVDPVRREAPSRTGVVRRSSRRRGRRVVAGRPARDGAIWFQSEVEADDLDAERRGASARRSLERARAVAQPGVVGEAVRTTPARRPEARAASAGDGRGGERTARQRAAGRRGSSRSDRRGAPAAKPLWTNFHSFVTKAFHTRCTVRRSVEA